MGLFSSDSRSRSTVISTDQRAAATEGSIVLRDNAELQTIAPFDFNDALTQLLDFTETQSEAPTALLAGTIERQGERDQELIATIAGRDPDIGKFLPLAGLAVLGLLAWSAAR